MSDKICTLVSHTLKTSTRKKKIDSYHGNSM